MIFTGTQMVSEKALYGHQGHAGEAIFHSHRRLSENLVDFIISNYAPVEMRRERGALELRLSLHCFTEAALKEHDANVITNHELRKKLDAA